MPSTRVPLLFGTMTFGAPGKSGARNTTLEECQDILDVFFAHGHREVDTARMYSEGTTEEYLSKLNIKDATVDTKVYPTDPGAHSPARLRATFEASLSALSPIKARVFYLHAPDRSVPIEETLAEVDRLHKEGLFETFGLSNFASWEVAEIVGICKAKNYVVPKIYQAMYNAITRAVEPELVPCVRKLGLRLVIYNPLAGGLLAGKISSPDQAAPEGGRFDPSSSQGKMYRARYFRDGYFESIEMLKALAEKHKLSLSEIALRWCQHHSVLTPEDGIILGASSAVQLEQNCTDSEKGPLDKEILDGLDEACRLVGEHCPPYWR